MPKTSKKTAPVRESDDLELGGRFSDVDRAADADVPEEVLAEAEAEDELPSGRDEEVPPVRANGHRKAKPPKPVKEKAGKAPKAAETEEGDDETEGKDGKKRAGTVAGLSARRVASLKALRDGKTRTHAEVALATGFQKGNLLRELTKEGLVETEASDGGRGHTFTITRAGKEKVREIDKEEKKLEREREKASKAK